MKLRDRVAIITGAARGIGKAVALTFVREGGKVVLVDLDPERLEILKKEIQEKGGVVVTISADIINSSEMNGMVAKVHRTLAGSIFL